MSTNLKVRVTTISKTDYTIRKRDSSWQAILLRKITGGFRIMITCKTKADVEAESLREIQRIRENQPHLPTPAVRKLSGRLESCRLQNAMSLEHTESNSLLIRWTRRLISLLT